MGPGRRPGGRFDLALTGSPGDIPAHKGSPRGRHGGGLGAASTAALDGAKGSFDVGVGF